VNALMAGNTKGPLAQNSRPGPRFRGDERERVSSNSERHYRCSARIDDHRRLPYKPARFGRGGPRSSGADEGRGQALAARERADIERQRRKPREADLSTEQSGAQAPSTVFVLAWRPKAGARSLPRGARADAKRAQCLNPRRGAPGGVLMQRLQATRRLPGRRGAARVPTAAFVVAGAQARRWRSHPRRLHRVEEGRNRRRAQSVRRRLKEIVRLSAATGLSGGHDYVLVGRRAALSLPFAQMNRGFQARGAAAASSQMSDQKNTILAIVLSALVLIVWQVFYGMPHMDKQKQIQQHQAQERSQQSAPPFPSRLPARCRRPPPAPGTAPQAPAQGGTVAPQTMTRDAALALLHACTSTRRASPARISLKGGAHIDDLSLVKYRETVDPNSPPIVPAAPSGSPHPFYARIRLVAAERRVGETADCSDTLWQQQGSGVLSFAATR